MRSQPHHSGRRGPLLAAAAVTVPGSLLGLAQLLGLEEPGLAL